MTTNYIINHGYQKFELHIIPCGWIMGLKPIILKVHIVKKCRKNLLPFLWFSTNAR